MGRNNWIEMLNLKDDGNGLILGEWNFPEL